MMPENSMEHALKSPEFLRKSVVYQIALRSFTPQGTLAAAAEKLQHVADTGADIVYLLPFTAHDSSGDPAGWSERQRASGFNNPKSPYRLSDYFAVDEEYGTQNDLRYFINAAHSLKLRVVLDLVYFHCGPLATVFKLIPDSVERNPDGSPKNGRWNFPQLNFKSQALREYLYSNMRCWAVDFGIDGFRCDVGSEIPLDFWTEGAKRMRGIRQDFFFINEGMDSVSHIATFDVSYGFYWSGIKGCILGGAQNAAVLRAKDEKTSAEFPAGSLFLRYVENHDIANDDYEKRFDAILPVEAGNAAFVLTFMMYGVPMLYNGNEIADAVRHSIFTKRVNGKTQYAIDWRKAETPEGISRMNLIRSLAAFRRATSAITEGTTKWIGNTKPEAAASVLRTAADGSSYAVIVNLSARPVVFTLDADLRPAADYDFNFGFTVGSGGQCECSPFGYAVFKTARSAQNV